MISALLGRGWRPHEPATRHHGCVTIEQWLLSGDPAVSWQTQRDLLGLPPTSYKPVRRSVSERGWGAALLAARGADGLWDGGLYSPKWTSTFYTLQTLGRLGLTGDQPQASDSLDLLLGEAVRPDRRGRWPNWAADLCVAGMLIRTASDFGFDQDLRTAQLADYVLANQLPDGGWNCQSTRGRVSHSSFHTSLSVLEGLAAAGVGGSAQVAGREFLLAHQLFRSHRTGAIVHPGLTSFSFPRYWYYDVLRALEHFARASPGRDARLDDAISLVHQRRRADGTWALGRAHPGRTWIRMEAGGRPSRMITLCALRVLQWWDAASPRGAG